MEAWDEDGAAVSPEAAAAVPPSSRFARREEHLPVFPGTFVKCPSARSEVYTVEIRIQRKVGDAANFPRVTGNRGRLDGQIRGGGKKKDKTRASLRWPSAQLNILHGQDETKSITFSV